MTKLLDLINNQFFCWFEMDNRKFVYKRNEEIRELYENASVRKTLAFYELNREREIRVVKAVMEAYKEMEDL